MLFGGEQDVKGSTLSGWLHRHTTQTTREIYA
jgi:hypothetical protein